MQAMPVCPECGEKVWDNRESKKNPKAPDFKCRDKKCDGAIWPDDAAWGREGTAWSKTAAPAKTAAGPGLNPAQESADAGDPVFGVSDGDIEFYMTIIADVGARWSKIADEQQYPPNLLPTAADVQSAAATIFISKQRQAGR
jgi:hypothetical protein